MLFTKGGIYMKLSELLMLHFAHKAAKEASEIRRSLHTQMRGKPAKMVPYEKTVRVQIPLDDEEGICAAISGLTIDIPPGFCVERMEVEASVVDNDDDASALKTGSAIVPPPDPADAGALVDVSSMTRSERRRFEREESRRMKLRLREVDRLLRNHTPQGVERILWEGGPK